MKTLQAKPSPKAAKTPAHRRSKATGLRVKTRRSTPTTTAPAISDSADAARRLRLLRSLRGSAPDFPDHTQ